MIIIVLFFLILAGLFKAKLDWLADSGKKGESWKNKYDLSSKNKNHWWYFELYQPRYPEKFPFSTTVLVFLTDSWHRFQFFMLRSLYLAIAVALTDSIIKILMLGFVIFPVVLGVPFEIFYSLLKKR